MPRQKAFNEEEVLEKAIDLFWEKGYNATSYADLVEKMGINRASIYATFGDKKSLYLKALHHYKKQNSSPMRTLFASKQKAIDKIEALFQTTISAAMQEGSCKGCFMVNTTTEMAACEPAVAQVVELNREQMEALLSLVIEQGQQEGSIATNQPPQAFARFIYNTHFGMQAIARSTPPIEVLEDTKAVAIATLKP